MQSIEKLSKHELQLIAAAATWGRVMEREHYGDAGSSRFTIAPHLPQKSALFRRLLGGKPPLAYRPPTSHSYPWYEVIEGEATEHHVFVGGCLTGASVEAAAVSAGRSAIIIDQALWTIEETIRENKEYIVSWGKYPMRWRLQVKRVAAGTVQERCRKHEQRLREYAPIEPEALQAAVAQFESDLRSRDDTEVDAEDVVWRREWTLRRIGLSGWPFAGDVLPVESTPSAICLLADDEGPQVLFDRGSDEGDDSGGAVWLRIEHDAETGVSRYVHGIVSARSKLDAAIRDDLRGLTARALAFDRPMVLDRRDVDGAVLGRYVVGLVPDFIVQRMACTGESIAA